MKRILVSGGLALAATLATAVSCKTSGSTVIDVNIPGFRLRAEGEWEADNPTRFCFELKFLDPSGNEVGSTLIGPGASEGSVPPTASRWQATRVPCPPQGGGDDDGARNLGGTIWAPEQAPGSALQRGAVGDDPIEGRIYPLEYAVQGGPLWFDRDSTNENALYVFSIRARSAEQAAEIAETTIEAPIGESLDPRVSVHAFFKATEGLASASVFAISKVPLTVFEMDVNGVANYATLGQGASQSSTASGTWIVEAPVSMLDIHGYGEWNSLALRTRAGDLAPTEVIECSMVHYR
jgi:hypothetical protein